MGKAIKYKKIRKETRKNADRIINEFMGKFDIRDYLRPRPKFFPKFVWNLLIQWIILKK